MVKGPTELAPLEPKPRPGLAKVVFSAPPHEHSGASVASFHLAWGIALLPAIAGSLLLWRLASLELLLAGAISASAAEGLCCKVRRRPLRIRNGHAALMGCLLALTLPSGAPLWLAAAGGAFGILFAQEAFGGEGFYWLHPALVGRLFVNLSWPKYFQRPPLVGEFPWSLPAAWHERGLAHLNEFLFRPGSLTGESSAALLVLGSLFLMFQGVKWRIPLGALLVACLGTRIGDGINPWLHGDIRAFLSQPSLYLVVGFLAVEPVTTPLTHEGQWVSGLCLGVLVAGLRGAGGDPAGLFVLPLALSLALPLLDRLGERKR